MGDAESAASVNEFGFNGLASDAVPLNRSIPDTRAPSCRSWDYPDSLPPVSIAVVFFNEPFPQPCPTTRPSHHAPQVERTAANCPLYPRTDTAIPAARSYPR